MFTGYAGWISGVRDWLSVAEFTDAQIATFIALGQVRLNRDLLAYRLEKVTSVLTVAGQSYLNLDVTIPDFNKVRLVRYPGVGALQVLAMNELAMEYSKDPTPGTPKYYAIDANQIIFHPTPSASAVFHLHYYQKVTPISATVDSNLFTEHYADALLYACCLEAAPYMAEDERIPVWESRFAASVAAYNIEGKKIKMGSTPLVRNISIYGGTVQVGQDTELPLLGTAPVNLVAPSIPSLAVVGTAMVCDPGEWSGIPDPAFTYQWYAGASAISGATSNTYTPVSGDVGVVLSCKVTADTGTPPAAEAVSNNSSAVVSSLGAFDMGGPT